MKTPCRIKVTGKHFRDGVWEETVTEADGTYIEKDDTEYFFYKEGDDAAKSETRITVSGNVVCVRRTGAVYSELKYEIGRENVCPYRTPFGNIDITTVADMMIREGEGNTRLIKVEYRMIAGPAEGAEYERAALEIRATL